jgi:hypothetical protein
LESARSILLRFLLVRSGNVACPQSFRLRPALAIGKAEFGLSLSVPFDKRTEVSRQLAQILWGNRRVEKPVAKNQPVVKSKELTRIGSPL